MHSYIREIPNTSQNYYIFKSTLIPPKKKNRFAIITWEISLKNWPVNPASPTKTCYICQSLGSIFSHVTGIRCLWWTPSLLLPFGTFHEAFNVHLEAAVNFGFGMWLGMTKKQKAHTSVLNFHMKMSQGKWVVKGCQTISLCLSSMITKNSFKFQNLIYKSSDSLAKLWSNLIISTIPTAWMFSYFSNPYHPRMVYLPTSSWFFWVNLGKYTWILCFPLNDFWPTILKLPN